MLQKNEALHQLYLTYTSYNYLYADCILVISHPVDGHKSDRNMLVKSYKNNNM